MQPSFNFDSPAAGKQFIGRSIDVSKMVNLLRGGECIALYDEPGTGKMSLIRQALTSAKLQGMDSRTLQVDFTRARSCQDILISFASGVISAFAQSEDRYRGIVSEHLSGTHMVFNADEYRLDRNPLRFEGLMPDEVDALKVFSLPSELCRCNGQSGAVILVTQFQNITLPDESAMLLGSLEKALHSRVPSCVYIFTGSLFNAMRNIFEVKRRFWKQVNRFEMSVLQEGEVADYVYRCFQNQGKVLEKDIIIQYVRALRCNMRYVNQLFGIADSSSFGYVNASDILSSMSRLLSIHRPAFYFTVSCLTDFQLSMLRAVIAGENRFSSSAIIDRYHLNSSANVKRLKEALEKKEIAWFDEKEEAHVIDPLFEYWLAREYFV